MVFVNTVTDVNIYTEVSTNKRMDKKPEVKASNRTAPETLIHKVKRIKIQIDTSQNTELVSSCSRRKTSLCSRCNDVFKLV